MLEPPSISTKEDVLKSGFGEGEVSVVAALWE